MAMKKACHAFFVQRPAKGRNPVVRKAKWEFLHTAARMLLLACGAAITCGTAHGQDKASPLLPPTVSTKGPAKNADETMDRLTLIEEQLRNLEERNQRLQKQYDSLKAEHEKILDKVKSPLFSSDAKDADGGSFPGGVEWGPDAPPKKEGRQTRCGGQPESGGEEREEVPGPIAGFGGLERAGAGAVPGHAQRPPLFQFGPFWFRDDTAEIAGRGPYRPDMPALEHRVSSGSFLGGEENGLTWQSTDGYFSITFHNLSQLDLREPIQQGDPLHGGFIIPRQRWYFEGKVGDYVNFVTSVNRGYATLDVLDSYADFIVHPEWLSFRVGRMKTPSQYEYISFDEANLIGPERSIYVQNYAGNRQLGAMAHGRLFNRRFEYYAGVFNGPRRSFEDFNSSRDYFFYLDYRPFIQSGIDWLKGLHLVGAENFGEERQPLSPIALRTMNQLSNTDAAAFVSPTILEFNNNVFENGPRNFYSYETVYYYKNWGFLSGFQGGYQDYSVITTTTSSAPKSGSASAVAATSVTSPFASSRQNANNEFLDVNSPFRTHVPIYGWSFQTWYFLTGEEITRRRYLVEPRRPFGYYNGRLNPGAIELFGKVSDLQLGDAVFRGEIVNHALWTNRAFAPEMGFNWYLTHFVKFTFDYQHVFLGNPVVLDEATGKFTKGYDLFLFRTQLFF
jgi:phosphate-selective porin OprO/OprP